MLAHNTDLNALRNAITIPIGVRLDTLRRADTALVACSIGHWRVVRLCISQTTFILFWLSFIDPTPWKDIAVLTSNPVRCRWYQSESQNVKGKNYCSNPQYNNEADCQSNGKHSLFAVLFLLSSNFLITVWDRSQVISGCWLLRGIFRLLNASSHSLIVTITWVMYAGMSSSPHPLFVFDTHNLICL